jgi:hypothetical protein
LDQRVFAVGLALAFAATGSPLSAQEADPETNANAASVVEITVIGSEAELARIRGATAASDLRGAGARWQRAERFERGTLLARAPGDAAVSVRAFVVLSAGRAELYFADRSAERFLVREVTLANGLDSVGSDAVSQVLTLSIVALAENAEAGLTRSQTEQLLAPAPVAAEPPSPPAAAPAPLEPDQQSLARSLVGATPFYAVRVFGEGVPVEHGPGLRLGWITGARKLEAELWASAQYEFPLEYQTPTVGVELRTVVLRLGGGVAFLPNAARPWRFGTSFALGADLVSFTPRPGTSPADLELAAPGRNATLLLSYGFSAGLRLGSHFHASAEFFLDVYPTRLNYTLSVNTASEVVLIPYFVRPGLALALTLR